MTSAALSRAAATPRAQPGAELVWLALTAPSKLWPLLAARPQWLPGMLGQCLLLGLASIIAAPAYSDLDRIVSGVNASPLQMGRMFGVLLSVALATGAANLAVAGLLWCGFQLAGLRVVFHRLVCYASFALLPLALGQALGKTAFALAMPLTQNPAEVLAWHLRPFSAGLASLLPDPPLVLSLPWALMASFDLFGIWALLLAASGLAPLFGARPQQRPWLVLLLVLVFAAGALGLWQAGQSWLAAAG